MTARKTNKLALVQPDLDQMEAAITDAAQQTAPIVSRYQQHLNRKQAEVNELMRERGDFEDRRALLRAQFEAADAALSEHVADIDRTIALHSDGLPKAAE